MVRILTCNLFSGRADLDRLATFVESSAIDVLCVQELGEKRRATLASALAYEHVAPHRENRDLAIFCRRPASIETLPLGGRDGIVARLSPSDWPGLPETLELLNVHIFAPHTWPYFPRRFRRRDQLEALLAFVNKRTQRPCAVVGDFNATPAWPFYKRVVSRFRDATQEAVDAPRKTWPNLRCVGLPPLLRIDHCFVSPRVRCDRSDTVAIPGSDHYGLLCDIAVIPNRLVAASPHLAKND